MLGSVASLMAAYQNGQSILGGDGVKPIDPGTSARLGVIWGTNYRLASVRDPLQLSQLLLRPPH
jgi:hypothetical protein